MTRIAKTLCLGAVTALLAACGGGGSDTPPDTAQSNTVPARAFASVASFVDYVGGLRSDDKAAPLDLGDMAPPLSETAEPLPLS